MEQDRKDLQVEGIPLLQISMINENDSLIQDGTSEEQEKRKTYEKEVSFIMDDEGEEFVSMEVFFVMIKTRGAFKTHSEIYDGALLRK